MRVGDGFGMHGAVVGTGRPENHPGAEAGDGQIKDVGGQQVGVLVGPKPV